MMISHHFYQELTKMKKVQFHHSIALIILIIHTALYIYGIRIMNIDSYWQLANSSLLKSDPLGTIFFFHGNPPLLSILFWFLDLFSFTNKYVILNILLPILHSISFLLFYQCLKNVKIGERLRLISSSVVFLNPLMFIYFLYPFYTTFIFISSLIIIYALVSPISWEKRLLIVTAALSFNSLIRASYHLIIIFVAIFPLMIKSKPKYIIFSLIILLLPSSLYIKNYILFDHLSGSSWVGMNLAAYLPYDSERPISHYSERTISKFMRFDSLNVYKETQYWPIIEKKSQKYNYHHPSLKQDDFNNYRYITISQLYLEDVKNNIEFFYSFKYIILGIFRFFESPAGYYGFLTSVSKHFPVRDIFELPNINIDGKELPISWYLILYILMILYYVIRFIKLDFATRYLFVYLMLFSFIYITGDNGESMRMRFEIESIYLFLFIIMLNKIITSFRTIKQ